MGLIIGSFLNVIIYRIPGGELVVWPGSYCVACGRRLKALDLIPVLSYILLRGRCRYCSERISIRYPLVEILTAVLFLLVYCNFGWTVHSLVGVIFTSVLIVVSFTDIEKGIIPDSITYPAVITGLCLSIFTIGPKDSIVAMLVFGGMFLLIAIVSGGGDIKLAMVIGAFVGLQGIFLVFIISSLLGGLWVILLLMQGKAERNTALKFGPFLAVAGWSAWMYNPVIMAFYLGLFF